MTRFAPRSRRFRRNATGTSAGAPARSVRAGGGDIGRPSVRARRSAVGGAGKWRGAVVGFGSNDHKTTVDVKSAPVVKSSWLETSRGIITRQGRVRPHVHGVVDVHMLQATVAHTRAVSIRQTSRLHPASLRSPRCPRDHPTSTRAPSTKVGCYSATRRTRVPPRADLTNHPAGSTG